MKNYAAKFFIKMISCSEKSDGKRKQQQWFSLYIELSSKLRGENKSFLIQAIRFNKKKIIYSSDFLPFDLFSFSISRFVE